MDHHVLCHSMNPALVLFQYVKVVSLDLIMDKVSLKSSAHLLNLYIEWRIGGDGRTLGVEIVWLKCSKDSLASVETGGWEGI